MPNSTALLPDWTVFERDYVDSGVPHLFVVRTSPDVSLFIDQGADRIGARFEIGTQRSDGLPVTLSQIHVDEILRTGRRHLEIWTGARQLFANFYRLVSEIVIAVVDEGIDPDTALSSAVSRWDALLRRQPLMSDEAQTGLFGELWLLKRLMAVQGVAALEAWVGPVGQSHDFRLGDVEIEVKTTSGSHRVHRINGLGQLQPSLGCSLYLLSLKVTNAGSGGRSLPEAIAEIEDGLGSSPAALLRLRAALAKVGYDSQDAHLYPMRKRLRDTAVLVPVTDGVPRLTSEAVAQLETRFAAHRVSNVVYAIDVEGLGVSDGTEAFTSIVPAADSTGAFNV